MKKNFGVVAILFSFVLVFLFVGRMAFGQTETVSPTETPITKPTDEPNQQEIDTIKEKIATKVAELREQNNKAVGGTITKISDNLITIKTTNDVDYLVKLDDSLTKVYQVSTGQKKEIKAADLKTGMYIIATGVINDKTIDANFVYQDDLFLVYTGKISEVNADDFYIKVVSTDKDTYTLDVESFTKMDLLNIKTLQPERVGFSKLKEGDTVHFVIKKSAESKTESNRYPAQKILVIPQEFFTQ